MKQHGLFRPPINRKNRSKYSRGDLWKMCTPQREREWWYGTPKLPDDVNVGYINSTHHITPIQCGLGFIFVVVVLYGGIIVIDDAPVTEAPEYKDRCHDCAADTTTDGTLLYDASDASHNAQIIAILGSVVDYSSQRLSLGRR